MAKNSRLDGPTDAAGPVRVLEQRAADVEYTGRLADVAIGGDLRIGGALGVGSDQALARPRAHFARARAGGATAVVPIVGDSFTEGYAASKRENRWASHLSRRLAGVGQKRSEYVPIATGGFSTTAAVDWPGGQAPWTYNGSVAGRVDLGADLHAATLASGAFVDLPYFGDVVTVVYTRTPTGLAAAAVTIDGVSVGTFNANGSQLPGQSFTAVPTGGIGDYGFHTIRVTATGAALVLEGAVVHDGTRFAFGVENEAVQLLCLGHAGFSAQAFAGAPAWATSLAKLTTVPVLFKSLAMCVFALGANDFGISQRTPAQFEGDLTTLTRQLDAAVVAEGGTATHPYLFLLMPTVPDSYRGAAQLASSRLGTRADVLDLRALLPDGGAGWGIFDAGTGHPNDAGQLWIADRVADYLDGVAVPRSALPQMRPGGPVVTALDPPAFRSQWPESYVVLAGGQTADTTAADSTVRERRHKVWLEAGTYEPRLRFGEVTTLGAVFQVLVGITNAGSTAATTGTTGNTGEAALTPVVIDTPGAYAVTIRKTATNAGAGRFAQLHLRKTA